MAQAQTQTPKTLIGAPHVKVIYENGKYKITEVKAPLSIKYKDARVNNYDKTVELVVNIEISFDKTIVFAGRVEVKLDKIENLKEAYENAERKFAEIVSKHYNKIMELASEIYWFTERYMRDTIYPDEKAKIEDRLENIFKDDVWSVQFVEVWVC